MTYTSERIDELEEEIEQFRTSIAGNEATIEQLEEQILAAESGEETELDIDDLKSLLAGVESSNADLLFEMDQLKYELEELQ